MTQKHSPGPWPMHIKHVHGTRDSDEMSGLGWDFDDDLNPPTPQLRGVLSKAADAKLVERTHEVPHECDLPGCPGPENKRKLEAFEELLARVQGWMQRGHMKGCYHADFTDFPDARFCQAGCKRLRAAIAKATSPQAP